MFSHVHVELLCTHCVSTLVCQQNVNTLVITNFIFSNQVISILLFLNSCNHLLFSIFRSKGPLQNHRWNPFSRPSRVSRHLSGTGLSSGLYGSYSQPFPTTRDLTCHPLATYMHALIIPHTCTFIVTNFIWQDSDKCYIFNDKFIIIVRCVG